MKNGTGYYADPRSPIASTPLKRKRNPDKPVAAAESSQENEPVNHPLIKRRLTDTFLEEEECTSAQMWGGKVVSLFSPVLRFFTASPTASSPGKQNVEVALEPEPVEQLNFDEDVETPEADVSYRSEEESEELEFCPYYFIQSLPAYEEVAIPNREHVLPKPTETPPKMSLVLDLDETLVHCSVEAVKDADYKFPVEYDGMEYMIHARKRPHMDHFLQSVAEKFEVIVFTASQKAYAEKLLDLLDPEHKLIKHRLYRDDCLPVDGNYLKDLTVLGRDLSRVVLVDNSPHAFGYQISNGIPIESWFDDNTDKELLKLLPFLEHLVDADDVRPIVARQFQIEDRVRAASPDLKPV